MLDALRQYHLLDPAQLTELARAAPADARGLARDLVRRGWLTTYQANELVLGRAADLLLGSYVLLEKLGEGGMGAVFKARNWKLGTTVALKLIRKDRLDNPAALRRFQREARAAAQLDHPNIVRALDADEVDGIALFVMELIDGIDLAKLVKQRGPLPVAAACDHVRQAALGLQHAHQHGLVHRDIKPANLLLASGACERPGAGHRGVHTPRSPDLVKILDFGLARLAPTDDESSSLTAPEVIMGTPDYIAPEQARRAHTVDSRADIYSLGCTLYYLLTGKVPFPGGTFAEKLVKHQLDEPKSVEALRPDVPAGLGGVLRKMMAKEPQERYQTAAEVAAVLAAGLAGTWPTDAARPPLDQTESASAPNWSDVVRPPEANGPGGQPHRRAWLKVAAGCGVAALGTLGGWLLWPRRTDRPPLTDPPGDPATPLDALDPRQIPAEERFDWQPRELVAVLGEHHRRHWDDVRALAVSPDGGTVAAGGGHLIRLYDPDTMRVRAVLEGHTGYVGGLAFSPDGRLLASASHDRTIRLWSWQGDKPGQRELLVGHAAEVFLLAFSGDGRTMASAGNGGEIILWDLSAAKPRRWPTSIQTQWENVFDLALAPDGKTLLARAYSSGQFKIFDLTARPPRSSVEHELGGIWGYGCGIAFLRDGQTFLTAKGSQVRLWDRRHPDTLGQPIPELGSAAPGPIALSADGQALATGGHPIVLWQRQGEKFLRGTELHGHPTWISYLAFAPDGQRLYSGANDGIVRRWDLAGLKPREQHAVGGIRGPLYKVAFAPDDSCLVAGGLDGELRLWPLVDGRLGSPKVIAKHGLYIFGLGFMPKARVLVCGTKYGGIHVWDLGGPRPTETVSIPIPSKWLIAAAIHPLGKMVAAGLDDDTVRVWTVALGEKPRERILRGPGGWIGEVTFSPDGHHLLVGGRTGRARLYDLRAGAKAEPILLSEPKDYVITVAFAPDGKTLATGANDAKVRVWTVADLAKPTLVLDGHTAAVRATVFAPDGQLASAGNDGRVILWDLATGKERRWWQLPGPVYGLAFSADSRHLATANGNGTVYILRLAS